MGQIFFSGTDAHRFVERVICNRMRQERARGLCPILAEDGGFSTSDYLLLGPERLLAIVNAATADGDFVVQKQAGGFAVEWTLQRPLRVAGGAGTRRSRAGGRDFSGGFGAAAVRKRRTAWAGATAFVMRRGTRARTVSEVAASRRALWRWEALMAKGGPHGLVPCGWGARHLRLESGYLLYGAMADAAATPTRRTAAGGQAAEGRFRRGARRGRRKDAGFGKADGVRCGTRRAAPRLRGRSEPDIGRLCSGLSPRVSAPAIGVGYLAPEAWKRHARGGRITQNDPAETVRGRSEEFGKNMVIQGPGFGVRWIRRFNILNPELRTFFKGANMYNETNCVLPKPTNGRSRGRRGHGRISD
jgi:glycine cleavage system aminomethyltransferase T